MNKILILVYLFFLPGCSLLLHRKVAFEAVSTSTRSSQYVITAKAYAFDLIARPNGTSGSISKGDLIIIRNPSRDIAIDGNDVGAGETREIRLDTNGLTVSVLDHTDDDRYSFDLEIVKSDGSAPPTKIWQYIDDGL